MKKVMKYLFLLCSTVLVAMIGACDDNTNVDEPNEVYIDSEDKTFNYAIFHTVDEEVQGVDAIIAKFSMKTTVEAKSDIQVTPKVDNALVNVYNSKNETAYNSIPIEDVEISGTLITKGTTISTDLVSISYIKPLKGLTDTKGYLIPVKIEISAGIDVKTRIGDEVIYLIVDVKQGNGIFFKEGENSVEFTNKPVLNAYSDITNVNLNLYSMFKVQENVAIRLSANNELVAAYNEAKGTTYLPIPNEDISFANSVVTMLKGETASFATFSYTGQPDALSDEKGYLIPIEITTVNFVNNIDEEIKIIEAKKTFYVVVDVYINNFSAERVADDVEMGVKQNDRTGYSVVSFTNELNTKVNPDGGSVSNMFVADATNWQRACLGYAQPATAYDGRRELHITIDLGSEVSNIKGFLLETVGGQNYIATQISVNLATKQMYDQGKKIHLGYINPTWSPLVSSNEYIKFSEPISARYIMLNDLRAPAALKVVGFYIYTAN